MQKRITRSNLIPASHYLGSQSPEECQEIAKLWVYVSIVKYKEIFALLYKDTLKNETKLGECF